MAKPKLNLDAIKQKLAQKKEQDLKASSFNDPERWTLPVNKEKKGGAVIRFLPAKDLDGIPFVEFKQHSFEFENGTSFWTICPSTVGKPCPVCEMNKKLWKTDKDLAMKRMAKKRYVYNILVVKEPGPIGDPENEGKVFKFQFGKQINDILDSKLYPDEELGETPLFFFDPTEGADFKIVSVNQGGYQKYDSKSEFHDPSPIDKKIHGLSWDEIYDKLFTLEELFNVDEAIPSYNEILQKYNEAKTGTVGSENKEEKEEKLSKKSKQEDVEEIEDNGEEDNEQWLQEMMKKAEDE